MSRKIIDYLRLPMEKSLYNYLSNSINFPFIKFLTEKERTLYGDRRSREMKGVAIYLSKNLFPELDKISDHYPVGAELHF